MENQLIEKYTRREKLVEDRINQIEEECPFTPALSNRSRYLTSQRKMKPLHLRYDKELKKKNKKLRQERELKAKREKRQLTVTRGHSKLKKPTRSQSIKRTAEKSTDMYKKGKRWMQDKNARIYELQAQVIERNFEEEQNFYRPRINKKSQEIVSKFEERQKLFTKRKSRNKRTLSKCANNYSFKPMINKKSAKMVEKNQKLANDGKLGDGGFLESRSDLGYGAGGLEDDEDIDNVMFATTKSNNKLKSRSRLSGLSGGGSRHSRTQNTRPEKNAGSKEPASPIFKVNAGVSEDRISEFRNRGDELSARYSHRGVGEGGFEEELDGTPFKETNTKRSRRWNTSRVYKTPGKENRRVVVVAERPRKGNQMPVTYETRNPNLMAGGGAGKAPKANKGGNGAKTGRGGRNGGRKRGGAKTPGSKRRGRLSERSKQKLTRRGIDEDLYGPVANIEYSELNEFCNSLNLLKNSFR